MPFLFHSILHPSEPERVRSGSLSMQHGTPPGIKGAVLSSLDAVRFDLGYLLPLNHKPLVGHLVYVVVTTEPFAELASFFDRFQKVHQLVRLVMPVHPLGDAGGGRSG